jgi:hypothetical protein
MTHFKFKNRPPMKYTGFSLIHGKPALDFKFFWGKTYAIGFWFVTEIPF